MRRVKDRGLEIKAVLSILFPMGAFLYSWKDLKARSSYWVFFIFFIVYGLCFSAEFDAADSFYYAEDLRAFSSNPELQFSQTMQEFFSPDSHIKDIFVYALYYITCLLAGDNYHVFFALVAIVFGYFFLRSFKFITDDDTFNTTPFFVTLAIIFTLSNPIFNINGVRFWTAAWMAVYATFQILLRKKKRYLLLLIILPLVHGSYYIFWFFFVIAVLVRHFHDLLPYIFFISFFVTDVALQILPDYTDFLPPFLQHMVWSYTESDMAIRKMTGEEAAEEALYARILMSLPKYFHVLMIFLLVQAQNYFKDEKSRDFLGFILGYGTLINMSSMIPSMGRFWSLLIPFYVYLWVHNSDVMIRYKNVLFIYYIVALYPTFRLLRVIIWTTDPLLFISNTFHLVYRSLFSG